MSKYSSMSLLTLTMVSPSMLTLNKVCGVEEFLHELADPDYRFPLYADLE